MNMYIKEHANTVLTNIQVVYFLFLGECQPRKMIKIKHIEDQKTTNGIIQFNTTAGLQLQCILTTGELFSQRWAVFRLSFRTLETIKPVYYFKFNTKKHIKKHEQADGHKNAFSRKPHQKCHSQKGNKRYFAVGSKLVLFENQYHVYCRIYCYIFTNRCFNSKTNTGNYSGRWERNH